MHIWKLPPRCFYSMFSFVVNKRRLRTSQLPPPPHSSQLRRPLLSDYVNVQRVVKQEHAKWQDHMVSMRRFCSCVRTRIALLKEEVYQAHYSGPYISTFRIKIMPFSASWA